MQVGRGTNTLHWVIPRRVTACPKHWQFKVEGIEVDFRIFFSFFVSSLSLYSFTKVLLYLY